VGRRVVIEDSDTAGRARLSESRLPQRFDLQDTLLLAGVILAESFALVVWWPSALALGAFFCLGFAAMIERAKGADRERGNPHE
jgi:hypothetical protein